MGGGDLNQKKSWHPQTMKNQERVWKAEQASAAEKRKLKELQDEIANERNREELQRIGQSSGVLKANDDKKLEWMYKGSELNREEYLTGRAIDKNFEKQDANERSKEHGMIGITQSINHVEHECIPFSIRAFRGAEDTQEQVDMQRKLMEDPLMAIKQREIDTRKKLLQNPVKLKEIHRMLQDDKQLKSKKRKESKKSKKKHKKRSKSNSSDDGSDQDLDALLAKKYRKIHGELGEKDDKNTSFDKLLKLKYEKLSSELDKMRKTKNKKSKKKSRGSSVSSSSDSSSAAAASKAKSTSKKVNTDRREDSGRLRSPDRNRIRRSRSTERDRRRSSSRNRNDRRRNGDGNHRDIDRKHRDRSRTPDRRQHTDSRRRTPVDARSLRRSRSPLPRHRESEQDSTNYSRRHQSPIRSKRRTRSRSPKKHQSPLRSRRRSHSRSPQEQNKKFRESESSRNDRSSNVVTSRPVQGPSRPSPAKRSSSSSSSSSSSTDSDDSDRKAPKAVNYGLVTASGDKIKLSNDAKHRRSRTPPKPNATTTKPAPYVRAARIELTDEEKNKRLREMQQNADWRDKERETNVKRSREEAKREAEQEKNQTFDKDYINRQMQKALSTNSSVEDRIKSKLNNIQRSGHSINQSFIRK